MNKENQITSRMANEDCFLCVVLKLIHSVLNCSMIQVVMTIIKYIPQVGLISCLPYHWFIYSRFVPSHLYEPPNAGKFVRLTFIVWTYAF